MIMMMRKKDEMTLGRMRDRLDIWGYPMTDDQFRKLTYRELKKAYKTAEKAAKLECEVTRILRKNTNPKPATQQAK